MHKSTWFIAIAGISYATSNSSDIDEVPYLMNDIVIPDQFDVDKSLVHFDALQDKPPRFKALPPIDQQISSHDALSHDDLMEFKGSDSQSMDSHKISSP